MERLLMVVGMVVLLFFGVRTFSCEERGPISKSKLCAYRAEIARSKAHLEHELGRLKEGSFGSDIAAYGMLRLIDLELAIADSLIEGKSGLSIDRLLEQRNNLLVQMAPSVIRMYDMLLNYATAESIYVCKLRERLNQQKRAWTVLYADQRHHFLACMADIFDNYYKIVRDYSTTMA